MEQYKILPDVLPWKELSYLVNVNTPEAFHQSIQDLLKLNSSSNTNNNDNNNNNNN
eukprot:CAMPEP_0119008054 /NCGR_PEP_ID=MMETSP1176-20130426/3435_1 /TAXON_ID=265551 /ORGANISM="Synedropsis recta cf, Strain CCMP1620" /LENGTH=55 /DNA_ID=CAMNT_0006960315 /DNA_START=95 /DNA_END=259 /DNA_ORIENTATION=-